MRVLASVTVVMLAMLAREGGQGQQLARALLNVQEIYSRGANAFKQEEMTEKENWEIYASVPEDNGEETQNVVLGSKMNKCSINAIH